MNGVPSNRSLIPWHAALFIQTGNDNWTYLCGGSLIRNQVVLTAAHCLTLDQGRVSEVERFRVILGAVSSIFSENEAAAGASIHKVLRLLLILL